MIAIRATAATSEDAARRTMRRAVWLSCIWVRMSVAPRDPVDIGSLGLCGHVDGVDPD